MLLPSSSSCSEGQFASSSSSSASASSASSSPHISFFTSSSNTSSESSAVDDDCTSSDSPVESGGSSPDEPTSAQQQQQQQQQQQPSRRRHYREKQMRAFEGRDSPSLVWMCSKAPRSPLPGAVITPSEEDIDYFHSSSHLLPSAETKAASSASQAVNGADRQVEVALHLARAPKYIPSKDSSSENLNKPRLGGGKTSCGGESKAW